MALLFGFEALPLLLAAPTETRGRLLVDLETIVVAIVIVAGPGNGAGVGIDVVNIMGTGKFLVILGVVIEGQWLNFLVILGVVIDVL